VDATLDPSRLDDAQLPARLGRYLLERVIADGGMGRVFEAVLEGPAGFRKPVALKVVRSGANHEALSNEARLGGMLKHPNIVEVYELGEIDGRPFIAMELVDGVPLDQVARGGALPVAAVLDVGEQVCAGLAHAHGLSATGRQRAGGPSAALVHRDVKPRNLLVDQYGVVKIADFGIALHSGHTGRVQGTLEYLSPEQARGLPPDPRSDLFSLGLVLVEIATGRPVLPRRGGTVDPKAILRTVLSIEEILASRDTVAQLDRLAHGLGAVLRKCLRLDLADRWADAGELHAAFRALRPAPGEGLADLVRPASGGAETPRPVSRVPTSAPSRTNTGWSGPRTNVGADADGFFGRRDEIRAVRVALAEDSRLVTLKGPGGSGKTRIARRFAREEADVRRAGAWFCDLSGARDVHAVVASVAAVLDLRADASDAIGQMGDAISARGPMLLVLDNVEQLGDAINAPISRWLGAAPELVLLATSRHRLKLGGEAVVEIGPLQESEAVELLRQRARSPRWDEADPGVLKAIVQRLDALPLAIELAAARARMLAPDALLARLQDRFQVIGLRGALDSSWDLLAPHEKAALAQLSVFQGTFGIEQAEAVLDLSAYPEAPWALDVMEALWDRSLVHADEQGAEPRFALYESIRAYAAERLAELDLDAPTRDRHASSFAAFAREHADEAEILARDLDDLVQATRHALPRDPALAAETFAGAALALQARGPFDAALALGARLLEAPLPAATRARVLLSQGRLLERSGAVEAAEAALTEAADAGVVRARAALGRLLVDHGRGTPAHRQATLERAVADARAAGDSRSEALAMGWLGSHLRDAGKRAESVARQQEALAIYRRLKDRVGEAWCLSELALGERDGEERVKLVEAALSLMRRIGDRYGEGRALCKASAIYRILGDHETALARDRRALDLCRRLGDPVGEGIALESIAFAYDAQGKLEDAEDAMARGLALRRKSGDRIGVVVHALRLAQGRLAQARLEDAEAFVAEGLAASQEVGIPRLAVWVYACAAELALRRADPISARKHLAEMQDPPEPLHGALVAWCLALERDPRAAEEIARVEALCAKPDHADAMWLLSYAEPARAEAIRARAADLAMPDRAAVAWTKRRRSAP
jgi:serine/threonine protein kinase/predicted ATPase